MKNLSVVVFGASGAVGSNAVSILQAMPEISRITALVRRPLEQNSKGKLQQHVVDVMKSDSYMHLLHGHDAAICTFGVGQPSKVSNEEFKAVDFDAVLGFAKACKVQGIKHFELLGAVAANPTSRSFYLKSKGHLREAIVGMGFERFSCFQPSMLITPNNRYGFGQALMLAIWPIISTAMMGGLQKYRGIRVEDLGKAMARNLLGQSQMVEVLHWPEIMCIREAADRS